MPPRVKITKDDIIKTALQLVRENGEEAINARSIASALDCSTQPLFSNFVDMAELKLSVLKAADEICNEYIEKEISFGKYPAYKASGIAYIRFAKEERELFKLLYMRNRKGEDHIEESQIANNMIGIVHTNTGLSGNNAELFHLEMWAYVHGIATMLATGFLDLDEDLISIMLTDSYQGLKARYEVKDK